MNITCLKNPVDALRYVTGGLVSTTLMLPMFAYAINFNNLTWQTFPTGVPFTFAANSSGTGTTASESYTELSFTPGFGTISGSFQLTSNTFSMNTGETINGTWGTWTSPMGNQVGGNDLSQLRIGAGTLTISIGTVVATSTPPGTNNMFMFTGPGFFPNQTINGMTLAGASTTSQEITVTFDSGGGSVGVNSTPTAFTLEFHN